MYLLVFIKLKVTNDHLPLCSDGSSSSDISFSSLKFSNIQNILSNRSMQKIPEKDFTTVLLNVYDSVYSKSCKREIL